MMRVGSLLIIVLLAVPMLRVCCLPPAQALPCHGTTQGDGQACILNQHAIVQIQSDVTVSLTPVFPFSLVTFLTNGLHPSADPASQVALSHFFIADVNLRTGVLLI